MNIGKINPLKYYVLSISEKIYKLNGLEINPDFNFESTGDWILRLKRVKKVIFVLEKWFKDSRIILYKKGDA
jgi:hypothetical protein